MSATWTLRCPEQRCPDTANASAWSDAAHSMAMHLTFVHGFPPERAETRSLAAEIVRAGGVSGEREPIPLRHETPGGLADGHVAAWGGPRGYYSGVDSAPSGSIYGRRSGAFRWRRD